MREHPIGFEKERRNIFDPEEDPPSSDEAIVDQDGRTKGSTDQNDTRLQESGNMQESDATTLETPASDELVTTSEEKAPQVCAAKGCCRRPRFDSLFCSDSCGVSSLELDLLHSFQESSDIHRSILRN